MQIPLNEEVDEGAKKVVSGLLVLRFCAFIIVSRKEILYAAWFLGCCSYAVIYLRLSLVFGFLYLGIAKLQHVPMSFIDSMVTALFMPMTFNYPPKDNFLKVVAGCHCIVIAALGFGVVHAYTKKKLDVFRRVAEESWQRLNREDIRTTIESVWRRTNAASKSTPSSSERSSV